MRNANKMNKNIKQIRSAVKAAKRLRRRGLTLTELLISIVIIALLAAFSIPAIDAFMNSMGSIGSATALINAALSSARAMAIKDQRYVGVRFQFYFNPNEPSFLLDRDMYMIFIEQNPDVTQDYFFRAIEGLKPVKLPPNIGVTDLTIVNDRAKIFPIDPEQIELINETPADAESYFLSSDQSVVQRNLFDITTFSIVFSPSGNLAVHRVIVRNKEGRTDNSSPDEVFNTITNVAMNTASGIATFMKDDSIGDPMSPLGPEPSRRYFLIFERGKYRNAVMKGSLYSGYLLPLITTNGLIYINPHTGTLIQAE